MNDEGPKAVFNIGSQQGNISNVAGDMTHHGDQKYLAAPIDMVQQELARLRTALSTVDLDPAAQERIRELLTESSQELTRTHPNADKVAGPLERLTKLLREAGAISSAGAALIDPLQRISSWLGASGQAIARLIS